MTDTVEEEHDNDSEDADAGEMWPSDLLGAALATGAAGLAAVRMLIAQPDWVHRRVDTLDYRDESTFRRQQSVHFTLPAAAPEITPEDADGIARVIATGRSDYPNQINNVLAFPGIFRGALDVAATSITEGMKLAAAQAIAACVAEDELAPDHIVPSVFDVRVAPRVAEGVARAAIHDGVVRMHRPPQP